MPERTIMDRIAHRCGAAPRAIAIRALGRPPLSYAELCEELRAAVARLRRAGIRRDDRVAVVLPGGPEMATACLAVCAAATCAPLNPEYKAAEFERFFETLDIRLLIVAVGSSTAAAAVARKLGIPVLELSKQDDRAAGRFEFVDAGDPVAPPGAPSIEFSGPEDVAVVLHTSGSTAEPKVVPLTQSNLVVSAENIARSLDLEASDRVLNMLPLFHIGGLLDLLIAPLFRGGTVILATDMSSRTFVECCREFSPTWYQGVPTMLQDVLARAESEAAILDCVRFRFVRSVSAPLPEAVKREFERVFEAPVIEMYGMTETTGLISSNPLPPGVSKPGSVGIAAGPELRVIDAVGNPARVGQTGELLVRGPSVMAGYEGEPDVNAAAFRGEWLRTGDEGYIDPDGYVFLTGRIKEIINRGGEKISPREIDERVLEHPNVAEAAAFAIPHETLGEEVALAVVAKPTESDSGGDAVAVTERELVGYLAERLAYFKVPRTVYFVESLPKTPSGKLKRLELAAELAGKDASRRGVEWVAPTDARAIAVAGIWERVLGVSPIGMHDDFFDLGGDSLKAATFIDALETEAGFTLRIPSIFDAPTVAELVEHLEAGPEAVEDGFELVGTGSAASEGDGFIADLRKVLTGWPGKRARPESLVVGRNTLGTRRPLFWCTNGATEYDQLCRHLSPDRPVYGMRSIRQFEWKSDASLAIVAKRYTEEIVALQPEGPFMVGGYCDGGKMAFGIARELQAREREVALLCLNDMFVPLPYLGRVAMFCSAAGTAGRHSPYQVFDRPELGIRKYYHGDVSVHVCEWGHLDYYGDRIDAFCERLARELEAVDSPQSEANGTRAILPRPEVPLQVVAKQDCRVEISGRVERHLQPGETAKLAVTVVNRSSVTWQTSAKSGIVLRNRWRNRDVRGGNIWLDGSAALHAPLGPNESVAVEIEIRAPAAPGRWKLYVDAVDEGVSWFGYRGARKFSCPVRISSGGRLRRLLSTVWPGSLRAE